MAVGLRLARSLGLSLCLIDPFRFAIVCSTSCLMLPSPATGASLCRGALTFSVNQASQEGDRCWYTSTLELQLASLELCRACRSVSTLHVLVNKDTPRRLWDPLRAPDVPVPSRVPLVRPIGLTWTLRTDGVQLISSTPKFMSFDDDFNEPIQGVEWPASLQRLSFGDRFNRPIVGVVWPASLQQLSFGRRLSSGGCFNQPVMGVAWPANLQQLSFGTSFDGPIAGISWPTTLRQLSFGYMFNQPILGVVWPPSLRRLSFGGRFNQPILGVAWPPSLQRLVFGGRFDQPILGVGWPSSLRQVSFGQSFNQPILGVGWPSSLRQVCFGQSFNQPILGVAWPSSLQVLCFGEDSRPLGGSGRMRGGGSGGSGGEGISKKFRLLIGTNAESLRRAGDTCSAGDENVNDPGWRSPFRFELRPSMNGDRGFDQPIAGVAWPASLKQLSFGHRFNQPILDASWPPSLERLALGLRFKQPVAGIVWPASLQSVTYAGIYLVFSRRLRSSCFVCGSV